MKKVLIVYDSQFGNTEKVARAMCDALATQAIAEAHRVSDTPPMLAEPIDLLVLGSPTQGFRPTKPMVDWLTRVGPAGLKAMKAAVFDTRIELAKFRSSVLRWMIDTGGYAAPKLGKDVGKAGATLVLPPEGFYVEDTEGPLRAGELERAAAWALSLLQAS